MLEAVQGQDDAVLYLRRVLDGHLCNPLLLVGPSGTGRKFSCLQAAREMVRDDESQVYQIDKGNHPDVRLVEPDGREIKVDVVRALIAETAFKPSRARMKFLILDGADKLTVAAANALLKVLEEGPDRVRFFLLAEKQEMVLPTIRSRSVTVNFRRLPESFILDTLLGHTEDHTKALVVSRLAEGSVGKAIRYLHSGRVTLRNRMLGLLSPSSKGGISELFSAVDSVEDLPLGLSFLEHILHDMIMLPHDPSRCTNQDRLDELEALRAKLGREKVERLREGLRLVAQRARGYINLPFHVKALLASELF